MKFKLLAGKHVGDKGKIFGPGAVIESDEDLVQKWPNKFERALPAQGEPVKRSKNRGNPEEMVPEGEEDDEKFQETENSDKDTTDRSFVGPKDKLKKAEDDLKAAEERVEAMRKEAAALKKAQKEADEEDDDEEDTDEESDGESDEEAKSPKSKLGDDDVTEDFEDAGKNDLLVFKKGREFFVAEKEDPNKALNKKPLQHGKVKGFIAKYLKD